MKVEQPSRQAPVPSAALLLISVVNSAAPQEGTEAWATPSTLRAWLLQYGLLAPAEPVTAADLRRLVDVREGLRAVLGAHGTGSVGSVDSVDLVASTEPVDPAAVARMNAALAGVSLRMRFDDDGTYRLSSRSAGVDATVGRVLDAVRSACEDGTWSRVKVCARHSCRWAFYDSSRNRSGRWCSMAGCGNTVKMRRAYASRREAHRSGPES